MFTELKRQEAGFPACDEGELAWKPYQRVMEANEVVSNIEYYLKDILQDDSHRNLPVPKPLPDLI
ncbi:hypothetical protein OKW24_003548 [Peribacillus simplex]|uniref:hypothetical protein n=1 Tax=Peribacillus TaxID=2675229 RepID=UPI0024E22E7A|nr:MULTISPECIES: hypothetical protein [Peribacillus]MDF9761775.1 hypothetical protein [Peribacillus simplex]MDV7765771.1 hypothetical protein [Peribacillus sp. CSMR9]MDW7615722.1 hypothetical protein [Peribacillus simplex]